MASAILRQQESRDDLQCMLNKIDADPVVGMTFHNPTLCVVDEIRLADDLQAEAIPEYVFCQRK